MKKIIYTQRVEFIQSYGEHRDCCDQMIPLFLERCGFIPIPIMNCPDIVESFVQSVLANGIFFTGGNDLSKYGGDAPERDETERRLLKISIQKNIPLFGICRGMQFIMDYFGSSLEKVDGHVKMNHRVKGNIFRDRVNSYHKMGAFKVNRPLITLGKAEDGVIEAVQHEKYSMAGIMWHPEREKGFSQKDINIIKKFYEGGKIV